MDNEPFVMSRREALRVTSAIAGAVIVGPTAVLTACSNDAKQAPPVSDASAAMLLSADDQQLIEEIADTILPTTPSSPGAKAAGVGPVMNLLLTDCTERAGQERATRGMAAFRQFVRDKAGRDFVTLSPIEREKLLKELDAEATRQGKEHYFHQMRELSHRAYFSSEIGMTKALRYIRVPGRWSGCIPLEPGQPAWG